MKPNKVISGLFELRIITNAGAEVKMSNCTDLEETETGIQFKIYDEEIGKDIYYYFNHIAGYGRYAEILPS